MKETERRISEQPLPQAPGPISWLPAIVRDGQNSDRSCCFKVHNVVRKADHCTATNGQCGRNSWHQSARSRHLDNLINRGINGIEELDAQVFPARFVPLAGETILRVR